jgi:ribosome recycling factor
MKTEQQPASGSPIFNSVKEVEGNLKARMEKAVSDLQHEMASIRTGRASLGILDHIRVDYYGTPTPLNQVANLHVPEPSLITIQPWDVSQIGPIERAIRVSDLGLNPANDGKIIRLPIPPLTEERRKELVKKLHGVAEHHRVSVRNIRRDGNEAVKKLLKDKKIRRPGTKKKRSWRSGRGDRRRDLTLRCARRGCTQRRQVYLSIGSHQCSARTYNPSVNSRMAYSRLALQTRDLDVQKTNSRGIWGDFGGTPDASSGTSFRDARLPSTMPYAWMAAVENSTVEIFGAASLGVHSAFHPGPKPLEAGAAGPVHYWLSGASALNRSTS